MHVAIAGTTGLIGKECLQLLNFESRVQTITSFQRRSTGINYTKVNEVVKPFDELTLADMPQNLDAFICCIGTTMKKAKTRERFRKVDFEYVLKLAKLAHENGCEHFLVVSAVGVKKNSMFFYNRVKAEMEEAVKQLGYNRVDVFQPSLLVGNRKEFRLAEKLSEWLFMLLNILLIGRFANYSSIKASTVAKSIVRNLFDQNHGVFYHLGREMKYKH